jgi:hypothetical protein
MTVTSSCREWRCARGGIAQDHNEDRFKDRASNDFRPNPGAETITVAHDGQ